ncbi:MAG: TRC40/GET3/ArsA family transport-energizing ATPase [Candidatus Methanomethylicia archaeon]
MTSRLIIYTGKGGVGKSVISSATGLRLAELGYSVLVMSSDPAHSLRDAFNKSIGTEPTKILGKLYALQIDPVCEVRKHFSDIQNYFTKVLLKRGIDEAVAYEAAFIPGATAIATLLEAEKLISEGSYDAIIVDTVPSGEALRLLNFPQVIGRLSRKLMKTASSIVSVARVAEPLLGLPVPDKNVVESELKLIESLERVSNILRRYDITSLRLIANPDSFSIENLKRSLLQACIYGMNTDLTIINKIFPEEINDEYFNEWKKTQNEMIDEVERAVYPIPVKKLKLYNKELRGLDMLRKCAEDLFKDEDPAKIYFKGKPIEILEHTNGLTIQVSVPFTSKDKIEVERIGDELTVKINAETGELINIIPLPAATYYMKLSKAKLEENRLIIDFIREHS